VQDTAKNIALSQENLTCLLDQNAELSQKISTLEQRLVELEKREAYLVEQLKLGRLRKFGKQTDNPNQLWLFNLEDIFDEGTIEEVKPEEQEKETITYTRTKKSVGRKLDTSKLPRKQIVYDLPQEEKTCSCCGNELEKIGVDKSEQIEYIPAQLSVLEHVCNKYTCRHCETIKTAKKPESTKCMAAPSLIADVIVKKLEHHLPWYRQSKIFTQDGLDIPANTICNWYLQSGKLLDKLEEALKSQLNNIHLLQVDETTVKVLKPETKGYMWVYHSYGANNKFVLFDYNDSRCSDVVNTTLENYTGILQADGYSGYNSIGSKKAVIRIGCWAHCRRKFVEVVKLSEVKGKAYKVVELIKELYKVEAEAREQNLSYQARQILRQARSKEVLENIHDLLSKITSSTQSALGKAVTYALNQWEYLIRYVDYGEAEIDNNWAENQIRPFALGRRNWLFIGNKESAKIASFFYSIIQTCRLNNIDPRKYLIYVLNNAGKIRREEVDLNTMLPQFIDPKLL
jgi:transposase